MIANRIIGVIYFGLIVLLLFPSCRSNENGGKDKVISIADSVAGSGKTIINIIVYGSKTCPHCLVFIGKLEQENIPYVFKEVDNDDANFQEMYGKIKAINYQGYVNYPVVDAGGEILVAPTFEKFKMVYW